MRWTQCTLAVLQNNSPPDVMLFVMTGDFCSWALYQAMGLKLLRVINVLACPYLQKLCLPRAALRTTRTSAILWGAPYTGGGPIMGKSLSFTSLPQWYEVVNFYISLLEIWQWSRSRVEQAQNGSEVILLDSFKQSGGKSKPFTMLCS